MLLISSVVYDALLVVKKPKAPHFTDPKAEAAGLPPPREVWDGTFHDG